jgi:hypothetical protein
VCGGAHFEYVDDSHIRCVECGHGGAFQRLTVVSDPNPSPAALAQAEELMRAIDAQAVAAFSGAPFRPYALDDRWSGLRWFGGHGGSGERTTALLLAFGEDPWDLMLPEVRVETRVHSVGGVDNPILAARMDALMLAGQQVDHLWRQTGVLRGDVRRSVFPRDGTRTGDPTSAWERTLLTVDGDSVEFAVLSEGAHWVAQAIIEGTVVGIQSRNWTLEATGLVTESNFELYERGAQELRRRQTRWPLLPARARTAAMKERGLRSRPWAACGDRRTLARRDVYGPERTER